MTHKLRSIVSLLFMLWLSGPILAQESVNDFIGKINSQKYSEAYALLSADDKELMDEKTFTGLFPESAMSSAFRTFNDQFFVFKKTGEEGGQSVISTVSIEENSPFAGRGMPTADQLLAMMEKKMPDATKEDLPEILAAIGISEAKFKPISFSLDTDADGLVLIGLKALKEKESADKLKKDLSSKLSLGFEKKYLWPMGKCADYKGAIAQLDEFSKLLPDEPTLKDKKSLVLSEMEAHEKLVAKGEVRMAGTSPSLYITITNNSELTLYAGNVKATLLDGNNAVLNEISGSGGQPMRLNPNIAPGGSQEFVIATKSPIDNADQVQSISVEICTAVFRN
ncbi:MAG: hypothetical protein JXQ90_09295 [Cyclobacteriaceae bacterium]